MRTVLIILLIFIAAGCEQSPRPIQVQPLAEVTGPVVKVIDGDTIDVLNGDKITTRVRLNGIDAPERKQAFSTKSKEHLSELIGEQPVRVFDLGLDQYGRTIGDVYSGDKPLNLEKVRDGMAWHFKRFSDDRILAKAEIEAQAAKRGLWADPKPVAPWEWLAFEKIKSQR